MDNKFHRLVNQKYCMKCGSPNILQVAHCCPKWIDKEGKYDTPENLIVLCKSCHERLEILQVRLAWDYVHGQTNIP
jgi:hypothetical protein